MMSALKSFSDNSNICVISMFVSFKFGFSCSLIIMGFFFFNCTSKGSGFHIITARLGVTLFGLYLYPRRESVRLSLGGGGSSGSSYAPH